MKPSLPDVYVTLKDGGLGVAPVPTENIHAKIGVSSQGPVNELVPVTNYDDLKSTFGTGPLVEAAAVALALAGGPVYLVRANASVAGSVSPVTAQRVGSSTGTVSVTGSPADAYQVIVEITRTGSVAGNDSAFRYSLDGGDTWSAEKALTASYALEDTGLTLNFTDGAGPTYFQQGDRFTFTTTPPGMSLTDLTDALSALLGDPREWGFVHVVGAASATVFGAVAAKMAEAEANGRYVFAVLEARDIGDGETESQWMNALLTEYGSSTSTRVAVVAGHGELVSPLTGRVMRRSLAWPYTGRLSAIPISEAPGRVATGPVPGIVRLYHDEGRLPGLDAGGFTTFRTYSGLTGYYVALGRMKAPPGSDFDLVQNRRVMDQACRVAVGAARRFLQESVRVDDSGLIDERDAQRIEGYIRSQLEGALVAPGHASAVDVVLKRDSNILSTRSTTLTVRVRPLGYLHWLEVVVGFENPALIPA
ncbi:DUF2586 domain-containing protein [Thermus sp. PS18]|uniref:DUF2586 family protein n=1 Tax=Thermus sp. PS18 TaxID=2849039 RepID=UPI002264AF44|nr:DUF2586 family protein [Thermus sp. PS18]UZX16558.1 DUF2586 domain-containing protein [Thermus sp. PS18]